MSDTLHVVIADHVTGEHSDDAAADGVIWPIREGFILSKCVNISQCGLDDVIGFLERHRADEYPEALRRLRSHLQHSHPRSL